MQVISNNLSKRVFSILVVSLLVLTFALAGCSSNNNAQSSNQQSAPAATEQKAPETITVNMTVTDLDGNVLYDEAVQVEPESNVFNVLEQSGIEFVSETGSYGPYVTAIQDIAADAASGWTYTVNEERATVGADQMQVADGDKVAWQFTTW